MKLPELVLLDILKKGIDYLKEDFNINQKEENTLLYYILGEEEGAGLDLFEEAKNIFIRAKKSDRKLDVRLFFDRSKAHLPTISITSPSEVTGPADGIGFDANYIDEFISEDRGYPVYTRSFSNSSNLIVSSDSQTETLIIYHVLKAFLISAMDTLELSGLRNPKISGGDLNLNEDLIPQGVFIKYVGLSYFHEISTRRWFSDQRINNIIIKNAKPIS